VIDWLVVDRRSDPTAAIDLKPVEHLHRAEEVDVLTDVVSDALPRFVAAAPADVEETLPRQVNRTP
jgi:hypothetical protein